MECERFTAMCVRFEQFQCNRQRMYAILVCEKRSNTPPSLVWNEKKNNEPIDCEISVQMCNVAVSMRKMLLLYLCVY